MRPTLPMRMPRTTLASPLAAVGLTVVLVGALPSQGSAGLTPVPLTKAQQACVKALNGDLRKVAMATSGDIVTCVKDARSGKLEGSVESCTTADRKGKVGKARAKTVSDFDKRCKAPLPPFGLSSADAVNAAADALVRDLSRDVLGPDLDTALGSATLPATGLCQQSVLASVERCAITRLREFERCKKLGLGDRDAPFDDATDLEACIAADPKGVIAKACDLREEIKPGKFRFDTVRGQIGKKCTRAGVELASALPGCGRADAEQTHACLERAAACRSCLAVNAADALARDCDLVDDALDNDSCPGREVGTLACTLSEDSGFFLDSEGAFTGDALAGALTIDCGTADPDSGTAPCACEIGALDPVQVPGFGWVCVTPIDGCPLGQIACDGGVSLDFFLESDHDIGTCTSNASCAEQCATACGADAQVFGSSCEGFCAGGSNSESACTGDAQCPGGTCNGPAGAPHGNACNCQCLTYDGEESTPGGILCNLGMDIRVESALPCDGSDVVASFGQHCVPFTTEIASAILHDQDHVPGDDHPFGGDAIAGGPLSCSTLATNGPSGMYLVSTVNAFDLPLAGDAHLLLALDCE